jgi:Fe-S-cluster-containing hydrogenase component 2
MRGNLAIVDPAACMDCEECMEVCMHGAITTVSVQPGVHVK